MVSSFDLSRLNDALSGTIFHGRLHYFTAIDSTNTRALADAAAGAVAAQVYLADEQTAGRGRGGNAWHSEPDHGLYLTMLVRPNLHSSDVLKLSMMTALAAVDAVKDVTAGEVRYAAIGIGINLNQLDFPEDLATTATSLRRELGHPISREDVVIALLRRMHAELQRLDTQDSGVPETKNLFHRFEEGSTWVRGKRVQVAEEESYTGLTDGLTDFGLLRVRCDDGSIRVVRHGGVREIAGQR